MLAFLIAISKSKADDIIYLVGIGASAGCGHFYDSAKKFDRHIEQDQFFIRSAKSKLGDRLVVTDPDLLSILSTKSVTD